MTHAKKYQIFISSTFEDLREQREEIIKACLQMGHIPIGMEAFSAANAEQWKVIQRTIDTCDYYVVVVANRYGSTLANEGGISYTEKEYRYAVEKGVPVLGFVMDSKAPWPSDRSDKDENKRLRLEQFKQAVSSRMVSHWTTKDDLKAAFATAMHNAFFTDPRPGWIPADQAADPLVANEIAKLIKENEELRAALTTSSPVIDDTIDKLRTTQISLIGSLEGKSIRLGSVFAVISYQLRAGCSPAELHEPLVKELDELRSLKPDDEIISHLIGQLFRYLDGLCLVDVSVTREPRTVRHGGANNPYTVYEKTTVWKMTERGKDVFRHMLYKSAWKDQK